MVQLCQVLENLVRIPSCVEPCHKGEALCIDFIMKISFHSYPNDTNFHLKSFAGSLHFHNEVQSNVEMAYSPFQIFCTRLTLQYPTCSKLQIYKLVFVRIWHLGKKNGKFF